MYTIWGNKQWIRDKKKKRQRNEEIWFKCSNKSRFHVVASVHCPQNVTKRHKGKYTYTSFLKEKIINNYELYRFMFMALIISIWYYIFVSLLDDNFMFQHWHGLLDIFILFFFICKQQRLLLRVPILERITQDAIRITQYWVLSHILLK